MADPSLTQQLVEHPQQQQPLSTQSRFVEFLCEPLQWLRMLCRELNPSFVLGVVLVYGLSQGFSGSLFKVVSDYYWKDVQRVQPSQVQLYIGFYHLPWITKPFWGLLTDVFPIKGYRRRPYFIFAGLIGLMSSLIIAVCTSISAVWALVCLVGVTCGMTIADVTIDACIAQNSVETPSLAPDLQTLCAICSSVGALVGYSTSGFFVHHLGAQEALGVLCLAPVAILVLGFVIYELRTGKQQYEKKAAMEKAWEAMNGMYKTIKWPGVWKPSLFMYVSLALSISTYEGQFYWYTDRKAGPAFSQEFVGMIYAIGAVASIVGSLIYQKCLKNCQFRNQLFIAQLLYVISGMLDLVFVLRWNLKLGISDYLFVIMEECISRIVTKLRRTPMTVICTRLCPLGIGGSFFALLMCIDSLGSLSSKWGGGVALHALHVTRTDFRNLWLVILVRNALRLVTVSFILLTPTADGSDVLIPQNLLVNSSNNLDVEEE